MLNSITYKGKANSIYNEILFYTHWTGKKQEQQQKLMIPNIGTGEEHIGF